MKADWPVADALTELAIRDGHRRLLDAFQEFRGFVDPPADGEVDLAGLRGTVAFLRQSVLPFARWEESRLGPHAEDTAFEHAFLAAEIDALAAAVQDLPGAAEPRARRAVLDRVRRHAHRAEAVLELHVLKGEDRELLACALPLEEPTATAPPSGGPRAMEQAEIQALLRAHHWGILATVGPDGPYAVPVGYGIGEGVLFIACSPGRKTRNLEADRALCLTVAEVQDGSRWRSVVVRGVASWVEDLGGRIAAALALHRQRGDGAALSAPDVARLARARIARIVPTEVTGRARGG